MSDLSDLAADVSKDLPAQVRKVIDTAIAQGWELNKPGMTLCLRLNHLTDELAQPVYISWVVGRTPTGKQSFKFMSCGTKGLVPLSGADLLVYLEDPTVIYTTPADVAESDAKALKEAQDSLPPWDTSKPVQANLEGFLGARTLRVEKPTAKDVMSQGTTGLRVQVPKVNPVS